MLITSLLLHYLEEYNGRNTVQSHADMRKSLTEDHTNCDDWSLLFYTLLLILRIAMMLIAVYEASRDQSRKGKQANFWIVFFALWFPEIYLIIHAATGWHKADIFCQDHV